MGLLVLQASALWAQQDGARAEALFRAAVRAEEAGQRDAALALYAQVTSTYPNTPWAGFAADRIAVLHGGPPPAPTGAWVWLLSLLEWLAGLMLLAVLMAALGWRAGFFWSWALAAHLADRVETLLARVRLRRNLQADLEARRANPRDSRARYNLGLIYFEQRKYELAVEELAASVEIKADRVDAQYHLGLARLEWGQSEAAEEALRRAVELREDFAGRDAQLHLAQALRELGRYDEADQLCQDVRKRQPRSCHLYWQLGRLRAAQRDEASAREAFQQVILLARTAPPATRRRDQRLARQAKAQCRALSQGARSG